MGEVENTFCYLSAISEVIEIRWPSVRFSFDFLRYMLYVQVVSVASERGQLDSYSMPIDIMTSASAKWHERLHLRKQYVRRRATNSPGTSINSLFSHAYHLASNVLLTLSSNLLPPSSVSNRANLSCTDILTKAVRPTSVSAVSAALSSVWSGAFSVAKIA